MSEEANEQMKLEKYVLEKKKSMCWKNFRYELLLMKLHCWEAKIRVL